jgi:hypothetical protein
MRALPRLLARGPAAFSLAVAPTRSAEAEISGELVPVIHLALF